MATDIISYNGVNNYDFDKTISINKINIIEGQGIKINRTILETKNIDILLDPQKNIKNDALHFRKSGLTQIHCKIAARNDICIGFSFNNILNCQNKAKEMGRIMQNIRLCRKYKVKMIFASFAKNKWELRSLSDLKSFAKVLGMTGMESNQAFINIENLLKNKKIKWIKKGVKIIE
ncbi:MAG: RNase P subunit p30 family protein [Nanoarchaeota archaeon]|nr:RNase P subunit p30 family protein [Nanoarchaeota archaeon]